MRAQTLLAFASQTEYFSHSRYGEEHIFRGSRYVCSCGPAADGGGVPEKGGKESSMLDVDFGDSDGSGFTSRESSFHVPSTRCIPLSRSSP